MVDLQVDSADRTIVVIAMNRHELISAERCTQDWSGVLRCVGFCTMNPVFGCKGNDLLVMPISAIVSTDIPATGITVYLLKEP